MDLRDLFASNLHRIRQEAGVSQNDLTYEAGISRGYLSQLEKGSFYTNLKIIEKLATALKVEPAEFFAAAGKAKAREEVRVLLNTRQLWRTSSDNSQLSASLQFRAPRNSHLQ